MNQKILILTGVLGAFCLSINNLNSADIVQSEQTPVAENAQNAISQAQSIEGAGVEEDSAAVDAAVNEVLSEPSPETTETPVAVEVAPVTTETASSAVAAEAATEAAETAVTSATNKHAVTQRAQHRSRLIANQSVDHFNKMINSLSVKKEKVTCAQAVEISKNDIINSLDLSHVSDFDQNSTTAINDWINAVESSHASGTFSPNLLLNLSNNNITAQLMSSLTTVFNTKKKSVILNISNTNSVNDALIDSISLDSIVSLNLSNTAITNDSIDKIIAQINSKGLGKLVEINLSGTNVSQEKIEALKETMKTKLDERNAKSKDNKLNLKGDRGVTYDKSLALPKFQKTEAPKPDLNISAEPAAPQAQTVTTVVEPVSESNIVQNIEQAPVVSNEVSVSETSTEIESPAETAVSEASVEPVPSATTETSEPTIVAG